MPLSKEVVPMPFISRYINLIILNINKYIIIINMYLKIKENILYIIASSFILSYFIMLSQTSPIVNNLNYGYYLILTHFLIK